MLNVKPGILKSRIFPGKFQNDEKNNISFSQIYPFGSNIDKLLKICFKLLLVDKKLGKINASTAIRKIADIIWSVSIWIKIFSRIF